ncbi:hypothetical protein [Streptomyces rhizosphaericola]|nr:hypothetical protein [Streptomyces rhizosphaericola]
MTARKPSRKAPRAKSAAAEATTADAPAEAVGVEAAQPTGPARRC